MKSLYNLYKLKENIREANNALTSSLKNTDTQITKNFVFSIFLQLIAISLLIIDILLVLLMPFLILCTTLNSFLININYLQFNKLNSCNNIDYSLFYSLFDKVGILGILFFTFPAVLILLIALSLLRHQKQLIAEIRHYSMLKHKIELYSGILKATQYMVDSAITLKNSDNAESAEYIQKVFDEIKTELLKSPNFDLNSQPHIFPEEGGNIVEILKSTIELAKISTEASKMAAESVKKAVTPTEK